MKYVQINAYSWGWADSIVFKKHRELTRQGIESYVIWGRGREPQGNHEFRLLKRGEYEAAAIATRFDGKYGFHNVASTRRLLDILDGINPDVVHLHSLIDYYVHVGLLFEWLDRHDCAVIWTLHDCWPFTGGCMHFTMAKCMRWQTACTKPCPCPSPERFPTFNLRGRVDWCYERKRTIFTSLPADRLTLIAPSDWMADLTRKSFLAKYPVKVVRNEVNRAVFKPTESDFRARYGLEDRFVVLGVAGSWGPRKGLDDFTRLMQDLDGRFAVVMVGLTRKQISSLSKGASAVVGLERTESQEELAGLYTCADALFNPTKEDNYPTVNLEAQACGTPVVAYDVGGCKETLWLDGSVGVKGYQQGLLALRHLAFAKYHSESALATPLDAGGDCS